MKSSVRYIPHDAQRTTQGARGFSLTEVLLAIGTIAVGMLFIAGVFPVAIHFTTVSSERTIAASVADEAFAKILANPPAVLPASSLAVYEVPPSYIFGVDFNTYPSTPTDWTDKRYGWSAICGRSQDTGIHTTVFVTRRTGSAGWYLQRDRATLNLSTIDRPVAVPVRILNVAPRGRMDELSMDDVVPADIYNETTFINDGDTIVDDATGRIYRVLERYKPPNASVILLDRPWQGGGTGNWVWVVPPPAGGGRSPCIAVYQKIIRF